MHTFSYYTCTFIFFFLDNLPHVKLSRFTKCNSLVSPYLVEHPVDRFLQSTCDGSLFCGDVDCYLTELEAETLYFYFGVSLQGNYQSSTCSDD